MNRSTMTRPAMAPWPLVMLAAPLLPFATLGGTALYLPQIPAALALFALTVATILAR